MCKIVGFYIMKKILKGSNSKFVTNLFRSFGVALVAVSSCDTKNQDASKLDEQKTNLIN